MVARTEFERESPLVLVVDDDLVVRLLERSALEQAGFAVEEAENGTVALTAFERLQPDAVLLDILMPEMDGFTVCEEIRKRPGGDLTPVFVVTGLDDLDSLSRAYEVGATDFIAKPINWRVLGHHVRYMVRASRALLKLRQSEAKNRALLNAIPDMIFRISREAILLESRGSNGFDYILTPDDLIGKGLDEVLPKDIAQKAAHYMEKAFQTNETQFFEYEIKVNDKTRDYEARIVVSGEDECLAIVRDMSERKRAEEEILRLAYYDSLTGLPNRLLFRDRLGHATANAQRHKRKLAVMFLDLDHFKRINDTLGHNLGDLLLQKMGDRIVTCVRSSDTIARIGAEESKPTVARMGGDEFIILLTDLNNIQHASLVAQRVLTALSQPFMVGAHEIYTTASIGITIYPLDSEDPDTLLKYADTAMYQAKDKGRNDFQFYTESMNAVAVERFTVENQLRKALARNEFRLYYQAQMDLQSRKVVGAEALVRWMHPEKGLVAPMSFIPLAEETGLIVPIGEWILHAACAQNRIWQGSGVAPMRVTVNISSVQFRQKNFVENVVKTLTDAGLDPQQLELELTESIIMENAEATIATLHALKEKGIRLSIDDFGTGYSSLSYLKRFPIDTLKIDQSFVKDLGSDPNSAAIVKSIVVLAHNLNLKVIAEGVETEQQMTFLQKCACDQMQGFLFHIPGPAETLTQIWQGGASSVIRVSSD
jgi:PAS domain S-box-containing protein